MARAGPAGLLLAAKPAQTSAASGPVLRSDGAHAHALHFGRTQPVRNALFLFLLLACLSLFIRRNGLNDRHHLLEASENNGAGEADTA